MNVISKVEFNLFFCHDECNSISYDIRPVELLLGNFQRILFLPTSLIASHYPLKTLKKMSCLFLSICFKESGPLKRKGQLIVNPLEKLMDGFLI